MKPRGPSDLLYLTILSVIVSGFFTGVAWVGVWFFQNVNVWMAVFFVGAVIVWLVEVNKDE